MIIIMTIYLYSAVYPNIYDHKRSPYFNTKKFKVLGDRQRVINK